MRWNEKVPGSYEEAFRLNKEAKGTRDSHVGAGTNRQNKRIRKAKTLGVKEGPEGNEMRESCSYPSREELARLGDELEHLRQGRLPFPSGSIKGLGNRWGVESTVSPAHLNSLIRGFS